MHLTFWHTIMGMPIIPRDKYNPKAWKDAGRETAPWYYLRPMILIYVAGITGIPLSLAIGVGCQGLIDKPNYSGFMWLMVPTIVLGILVSLIFLMHRLGKVYYYNIRPYQDPYQNSSFPFPFTNKRRYFTHDGYDYKEDPSKCILCARHPINKKYHLFEVHELDRSNCKIDEYFVTCDCNKCLHIKKHFDG